MAVFDLLDRVSIVIAGELLVFGPPYVQRWDIRCHGNVSTVEDRSPAIERVGIERHIVAPAEAHFA